MLCDNTNLDSVFLCLDNDEVGQSAAKRMAKDLAGHGIQVEILVPSRKDWNEDLLHSDESEDESECQAYEMILHSDQGSVYASKAFNDLLPMYSITHSMSRAGTPTDNAAMEAINGWIKAELFMDFHVTGEKSVETEIDEYINFFNEQRPAYSLNYLTPVQYRESNLAVCADR